MLLMLSLDTMFVMLTLFTLPKMVILVSVLQHGGIVIACSNDWKYTRVCVPSVVISRECPLAGGAINYAL